MDLYSLHASAEAVIEYLSRVDPKAAKLARERYGSFLRFGSHTQNYSFCVRYGLVESAEAEAVQVLTDLLRKRMEYMKKNQRDGDEQFIAELNALVVSRFFMRGSTLCT